LSNRRFGLKDVRGVDELIGAAIFEMTGTVLSIHIFSVSLIILFDKILLVFGLAPVYNDIVSEFEKRCHQM
jgi:hypothetical protein